MFHTSFFSLSFITSFKIFFLQLCLPIYRLRISITMRLLYRRRNREKYVCISLKQKYFIVIILWFRTCKFYNKIGLIVIFKILTTKDSKNLIVVNPLKCVHSRSFTTAAGCKCFSFPSILPSIVIAGFVHPVRTTWSLYIVIPATVYPAQTATSVSFS